MKVVLPVRVSYRVKYRYVFLTFLCCLFEIQRGRVSPLGMLGGICMVEIELEN